MLLLYILVEISSATSSCKTCHPSYRNRVFQRSSCCLQKVPNNIPNDSLVVNLHKNKITHIPSNIFNQLSKCTRLNLCCQDISSVQPTAFNGLVSLIFLHLGTNKIQSLHVNTFSELISLKTLLIHDNYFDTLEPAVLAYLPRPLQISMTDNSQDRTRGVWNCKSLCWLKHQEKLGSISWWKAHNRKLWPLCKQSVNWQRLGCSTEGMTSSHIYPESVVSNLWKHHPNLQKIWWLSSTTSNNVSGVCSAPSISQVTQAKYIIPYLYEEGDLLIFSCHNCYKDNGPITCLKSGNWSSFLVCSRMFWNDW